MDTKIVDENINNMSYPDYFPALSGVDVPLRGGEEAVSIDFVEELPPDPSDLATLLENEKAALPIWISLATGYYNKGMVDEAIELMNIALKSTKPEDSGKVRTFLTWCYLHKFKTSATDHKQHIKNAEQNLELAYKGDRNSVANIIARIDIYFQKKNFDKAWETLEKVPREVSQQNLMLLLLRAKLSYQRKNYKMSLKSFQELLLLNPVIKPDPRIGIGMCFWQLKDYAMATKAWERAYALDNTNFAAQVLSTVAKFQLSYHSANDTEFVERFTEAMQQLAALHKVDNTNPVLRVLLQTYRYFKKEYAAVLELHEQVKSGHIAASETVSDSYLWAARAHYALGDYTQAFKCFNESVKSNQDNVLARFGVGQTQIRNNLLVESILTFENLHKTNENLQELNYVLGLLHWERKSYDKAAMYLEKYVRLVRTKKNQQVYSNAYLVLSQLHERKSEFAQALEYLSRAMEQLNFSSSEIPVEVLNNLGCFHFQRGDIATATKFFEGCKKDTTVQFNLARCLELSDPETANKEYADILAARPGYIYARIRKLYLDLSKDVSEETEAQIKDLLTENESNLEVRSFYSWYLKNAATSKVDEAGENLLSKHNRETLVKHDSHDQYALISLANLYISLAKDSKDIEKVNSWYIKSIQLFQKVLQIDPQNVFAAQGLAIVFAENKHNVNALEILRKIRDSLDNESVYLNLAHCLVEMKQYAKAIENYEIVIKRYGNHGNMSLLGRAWYLRAVSEKSLPNFYKALEVSNKAFESTGNASAKFVPSLKFNVAFVQFQLAEFVRKLPESQRSTDDIKRAISELETAITSVKEVAQDEFAPFSAEDLEQRVKMGENTLIPQLQEALVSQEEYEKKFADKLADARKQQETAKQALEAELEQQRQKEQQRQAELAAEFNKLQEEAKALMEQRDNGIVDDEEFEEKPKKSKKKDGEKRKRTKKQVVEQDEDEDEDEVVTKRSNKKFKSNDIIDDSDEEVDYDEQDPVLDDDASAQASEEENE